MSFAFVHFPNKRVTWSGFGLDNVDSSSKSMRCFQPQAINTKTPAYVMVNTNAKQAELID